jgi:cellobiose phosphorylase
MNYGHFDDDAREYVITRPDTPRPWSNYIGSAVFGGLITNNAAGYTFYRSAAQGRLSRYSFNAATADLKGRTIYLRDADNGDYWTHAWLPIAKPLQDYKTTCRHGTGYTTIESTYADITSKVTTFVPQDQLFETWHVTVTNGGETARKLQLYGFVEPQTNWNALDDHTNLQYTQYIIKTDFVDGMVDIGSNVNMPVDPDNFTNKDQKRHTFFGLAGAKPDGFDGDLAKFQGPYGNQSRPQAVIQGGCTGSKASGDMGCAALQLNVTLQPGESRSFSIVYGVGHASTEGQAAAARVDTAEKVEAELGKVKQYWHGRLDTLSAQTPDAGFNSMLKTWAPFNNLMTFYWSRAASLVYAGERDGLGYRDTLQDIVGSVALITEASRQRLELMITGQFSTGGAKPIVQPFHHKPGHETPPTHYRSDDTLWLFNAVPAYVKETGDLGFYNKVLPYADSGEATVLGHMRRALEFSLQRSGAHGLPCGLDADWNDCLRLGEKGESVFVAMQLRYGLRDYIQIAERLEEAEEVAWAKEQLARLDHDLETHAWDGSWYLRAFRYDGLKFGSESCEEGKVFMNPQTWAVLSGAATGERAQTIMQSMHEHLSTDYGIMLCTPPYVTTDPEVCLARMFNPGMKENGGVFNHTQGWAVMAAAELGMGDRAWEYLSHVLPSSYNDKAEVREVEPYVVCQSTHSRFSPRYGTGRVSWLSGSAVWNYVAMSYAILGFKPDYDGLRLDPCLPKSWPGYTATRRFRGATYKVEVKNPSGISKGIKSLTVDGNLVEGNLIPLAEPGTEVKVVATMG